MHIHTRIAVSVCICMYIMVFHFFFLAGHVQEIRGHERKSVPEI
jgi:hypothetical protein